MATHGNHKIGSTYYWKYSDYDIGNSTWRNNNADKARYSLGNCYKTKEEAEQAIEILKIHNELKHYAEEHNEAEIDWSNDDQCKYLIRVDFDCGDRDMDIDIDYEYSYKQPNQIYFTSHEIAEDAIKAIGEDRVKMWLKA